MSIDTHTMDGDHASTRLSMNGSPGGSDDALPVRPFDELWAGSERVEGRMETFSERTK